MSDLTHGWVVCLRPRKHTFSKTYRPLTPHSIKTCLRGRKHATQPL